MLKVEVEEMEGEKMKKNKIGIHGAVWSVGE